MSLVVEQPSLKRKVEEASDASPSLSVDAVPSNLSELSREDLETLVRRMQEERSVLKATVEELKLQVATNNSAANKRAKQTPAGSLSVSTSTAALAPSAAVPAPPALVTPTANQVLATRKRLGKAAVKIIKKGIHGGSKKPVTEISEGNVTPEMATAIMNEFCRKGMATRTSDTARMTKWKMTAMDDNERAIADLLQTDRLIHPVKHDGKGFICFGGGKPKVYAWAAYDSCEVKHDKREGVLSFKIKTVYVDSGTPEYKPNLLMYAKCKTNYR